jgi:putative membrane protein
VQPSALIVAKQGSPAISSLLTLAGLAGLALVGLLIVRSGANEVAHAMLTLGWRLLPITLFHLLPLTLSALSWRELLSSAPRLNIASAAWIRWIRESINNLLPVASIGGDVVSVRLARLRGVDGAQAAASLIVDTTIGVICQLVFVLAGVTLLLYRSTDDASLLVARVALTSAAGFVAAIALFVWLQHKKMLAVLTRLAHRITPADLQPILSQGASAIDGQVVAAYRRGPALLRAAILRLASLTTGAGEVWLAAYFLGRPVSALDAFILESLASGIFAAAFFVPGALGALEGGFVVFGAIFGLPADISLSIALTKRVRELLLGLPGLLAWQWRETQGLLRRRDRGLNAKASTDAPSNPELVSPDEGGR